MLGTTVTSWIRALPAFGIEILINIKVLIDIPNILDDEFEAAVPELSKLNICCRMYVRPLF